MTSKIETTTDAVDFWNTRWQNEQERKPWSVPHKLVEKIVPVLLEKNAKRVLDLGCGIGRHSLFLAKKGFEVHALDAGSAGIDELNRQAKSNDLNIQTYCSSIDDLPFDNDMFDYVLCWDTIYHGQRNDVASRIDNINRILKSNGLFQGTLLSKENQNFGEGTEISKDTFIKEGNPSDKAHPHFYCDASDLEQLLHNYRLIELEHLDYKNYAEAYHWLFICETL